LNKRRGTSVIYGMMVTFLIAAIALVIALVIAVIGYALVAPSTNHAVPWNSE
jgi:ABC-type phosphate/phosphonate transport system permease subunit